MADITITLRALTSAVSPLRVNAPPSIRGGDGARIFGNQMANSLAGDLESIAATVNTLYAILRTPVTATATLPSAAVAALPTTAADGEIYYSPNAKNILDDGAVAGSIAVAAGHGSMVCKLNGSWRIMA